jgi:hypothetical protein
VSVRVIATAYGAAALAALRDVVREAKRHDAMAPVTLLVPNNVAGIVARRHLANGLGQGSDEPAGLPTNGVAGLALLTLQRLAERMGAAALAPRRPATRPILSAAWRSELQSAPGVFDRVKDHPATIQALVAAYRELRDLSGAALDRVAAVSPLSADLIRLHRRVSSMLAGHWYDQADLFDAATAILTAGGPPADLGQPVLYLPQRLGPGETRFARALADEAETTVIVGLTAVPRADEAVEAALGRLGAPSAPASMPRPKERTATTVLHASDSDDEVRCVVRQVVSALDTTPAHRVAVLYGAAQPYARLIHEHLAAAGVTVNGTGTRPVAERALASGFLDILRLAAGDVPRADLFTALSQAPTRAFDGTRLPVSRWERISRSAAVVRGDDWDHRLTDLRTMLERYLDKEEHSEDPSPARLDSYRRDIESITGLRTFALELRERLRRGQALDDWQSLSHWASELRRELYGDAQAAAHLPPEEQYAAVTVESALRGLAELSAFEPRAGLAGLIDALTIELESALPRVGRFGDGVFVAPLSAAIGLDADIVYVVGLAEDSYPGRPAEDALLSEAVRESSGGELPSYRDRLDTRHRHLLAAFDAAPVVVASFPRGDLRRSTRRLPSRWLLQTLRELTGDSALAATDWESASTERIAGSPSFARSLLSSSPATEQEWRTRAARTTGTFDGIATAGLAMLRARASSAFTRYDGNLTGAAGLPDFAGTDRLISPTALEAFATCPHGYFVQRLLRVDPVEQPEEIISISATDIGNLMHQVMDAFVTECAGTLPGFGQPWTAEQRTRLREIAIRLADDYERRGATGHHSLWLVERDRILADLDSMLDEDDSQRREQSARVVRSELAFGFADTEPVHVDVPRGTVRFRGSADKVDQRRDGTLLVVDIKSGSPKRFAGINKDALVGGTKLQLPVYALAARQLLGAERAEAAYWFVRRGKRGGTSRIEVTLTDDLYDRFRAAVGVLVSSIASGLFPAKAPDQPDFLWVQCPFCNPDGIGHGDARTRWERKRHDPRLAELVSLIDTAALEPQSQPVASGRRP